MQLEQRRELGKATEAGPGGLGVPGPGDVVWFDDARDANCNVNTAVDVARLTMNTGHTGTVAQNNNAISVAVNATLSSGTFNGGTGTFTVNGNFILSGATFQRTSNAGFKKGTQHHRRNVQSQQRKSSFHRYNRNPAT